MKKIYTKLESHIFIEKVKVLYLAIIKQELDIEKNEKNNWKIIDLWNTNEYVRNIFDMISQLMESIQDLYICEKSIKLPTKKTLEQNSIKKCDYIRYHIQIRYIKICTIFDITLLIISKVQKLWFRGKNCNYKHIIENLNTNKKIVTYLKEFNKWISWVKSIRNNISHWWYFYDEDLSNITKYEYILENSKILQLSDDDIKIFKLGIKINLKKVVLENQERTISDMKEINGVLSLIFDELYLEFKRYL